VVWNRILNFSAGLVKGAALPNIMHSGIKLATIYGRKKEEEYCGKPLSYVMVRYGISVVIVLRFAKH
jgi:hypothetical protein